LASSHMECGGRDAALDEGRAASPARPKRGPAEITVFLTGRQAIADLNLLRTG